MNFLAKDKASKLAAKKIVANKIIVAKFLASGKLVKLTKLVKTTM